MRLFAQLSWYFRREWRRYLGAVALLVIIAMLQLVPPKVVGIVVMIELAGLEGRKRLDGYRLESAICYEGK